MRPSWRQRPAKNEHVPCVWPGKNGHAPRSRPRMDIVGLCPLLEGTGGHVPQRGLREGMSPGAARRGGRNLLGGHDESQRDDDVGAPGADGAAAVGPGHELPERIREAALDPVAHHHAGAQRRFGEEMLRPGRR